MALAMFLLACEPQDAASGSEGDGDGYEVADQASLGELLALGVEARLPYDAEELLAGEDSGTLLEFGALEAYTHLLPCVDEHPYEDIFVGLYWRDEENGYMALVVGSGMLYARYYENYQYLQTYTLEGEPIDCALIAEDTWLDERSTATEASIDEYGVVVTMDDEGKLVSRHRVNKDGSISEL